jgi:hypothetical protein
MATSQEAVEKRFAEQDKHWGGPRFFVLGILTLIVCVSAIYYMSSLSGCSLQIVP